MADISRTYQKRTLAVVVTVSMIALNPELTVPTTSSDAIVAAVFTNISVS